MATFAAPTQAKTAAPPSAGARARVEPARLKLGAVGDRWEREADTVAARVMAGRPFGPPPSISAISAPVTSPVQRTCAGCGGELVQRTCAECGGELVQRQCASCSSEDEVQRKEAGPGAQPSVDAGVQARIDATRGRGAPLPEPTRKFFEAGLGRDLSGVRVHTGAEASALNRRLDAHAFTVGRDVYFAPGRYAPDSPGGGRLLAHELTHTIQQSGLPRAAQRVQRATDAEYEASSGLDTAIRAGRMTPAAGVNGTTFPANSCGPAGCTVNFRFNRAFVGTTRSGPGVYVSIAMTQTTACGACGRMRPFQVARTVRRVAGTMQSGDPENAVRRQRSGWKADGSGPIPGAASPGWRVDQLTDLRDPFWTGGQDYVEGNATTAAVLRDAPAGFATDRNYGNEFRTCAVCYDGAAAGRVLGCVTWGYYINDAGVPSLQPAPAAACGAPQVLRDSVARWNTLGNTSPNIAP